MGLLFLFFWGDVGLGASTLDRDFFFSAPAPDSEAFSLLLKLSPNTRRSRSWELLSLAAASLAKVASPATSSVNQGSLVLSMQRYYYTGLNFEREGIL